MRRAEDSPSGEQSGFVARWPALGQSSGALSKMRWTAAQGPGLAHDGELARTGKAQGERAGLLFRASRASPRSAARPSAPVPSRPSVPRTHPKEE